MPPPGVPKGAAERVKEAKGAKVKRSGEFSWADLAKGDLLYEGDQVRTQQTHSGVTTSRGGVESRMIPDSLRETGARRLAPSGPQKHVGPLARARSSK